MASGSDPLESARLLRAKERHAEALQALGDPTGFQGELLRAELLASLGRHQEASDMALGLAARAAPDSVELARTWRVRALALTVAGDHEAAAALHRRGQSVFVREGERHLALRTALSLAHILSHDDIAEASRQRHLIREEALQQGFPGVAASVQMFDGWSLLRRGRLAEAIQELDQASQVFRSTERGMSLCDALEASAFACQLSGDVGRAEAAATEARELAHRLGQPDREARALQALGQIRRTAGDLSGALAFMDQAIQIARQRGHAPASFQLNRIITALLLGRVAEVSEALRALDLHGLSAGHLAAAHLCRAVVSAREGDWVAFDRSIALSAPVLDRIGWVEADLGALLATAADACEAHGGLGRAARARSWAFRQHTQLSPELAERDRASLVRLRAAGATVPVGAYDLEQPIGRGSMGEVWRARHRASGTPVAVKALRADRHEASSRAYAQELRTIAALDHGHIMSVLDRMEVSEAADAMTGGRLRAGTPCLVLELVSGGSLSTRPPRSWRALREALLALLSALAHAHARGVLHLDVKPANVMRSGTMDGRPGIKLGDFGLGFSMDFESDTVLGGTPATMAPEQFLRAWRSFGPWTDLYAVGCTAWHLATGSAPFGKRPFDAVRAGHCHGDLPAFSPTYPVPVGLEIWLRRCLAKRPGERFSTAADAAAALRSLGEADGASDQELPEQLFAAELGDTFDLGDLDREVSSPSADSEPSTVSHSLEPTPSGKGAVAATLGLGLFELRRPPLVGREHETAALWEAMREVSESGVARVVLLEGARGVGRGRLATWIGEQAAEAGAAWLVRTHHAADQVPGAGLSAMVQGILSTSGLAGPGLRAHLAAHPRVRAAQVDPDDLADLIAGAHPQRIAAQTAATAALLHRVARPLVLVVHDAHLARHTLDLVRRLLEARTPMLALLTASPEERPAQLTALLSEPQARVLAVEALSRRDARTLVRRLLPLEDGMVEQVATRSAGNPAFICRMLGAWVRRGDLVEDGGQLVPRMGASLALPEDLHSVMSVALETAEPDPEARIRLEVAAVLGSRFQAEGWARASGGDPLELSRWSAAGILAAEGPGWWTFTSSMQRESLLEAAGERSKAHHGAIAAVLRSMRAEGTPVRAARLGVHCFSAGAFAEATPLLQEAAKEATGAEQVRLVGLWEQCVLARGLPRSHPHRVEAGLARVRILLRTGRFDPARSLASTLVGDASNPDQTSRAHLALANALYGGNLAEPARAAYEAAARGPAARVKVAALRGLARLHTRAHNRAGALDMLERAQRLATPRQAATLALERARVLAPHQPDEQRAVLEEVVAEAERMQHPKLVALALSELASLHRRAEALQAAEELFSRALDLFEQIDDNNALYVRANLTMLRMRAGSPDEARQALLTIRRSGALLQLRSFVADMDSLLLATLIYAEHAAWEEARGVAEARVPTGNRVLSWSWNMAAVLAHDGGQPARAQALWRLAHAEAEAADDAPLVHTIAARLDGNPA